MITIKKFANRGNIIYVSMRKKLLIFLFFISISLFLFKDIIFKAKYFADNIIADVFFIHSHILSAFLKSASFLWNPYFFCGFPLLADIDYYNILSPFTLFKLYLPLFTPLSKVAVSNFMYIFYFSISGFFMYLYARSINIKIIGALTAGMVFAMIRLHAPNILNTYIWFPFVLFLLNKALNETINWQYVILTGFFYGIELLGGGVQYSYYFSLFFIAYFIFKSALIITKVKNSNKFKEIKKLFLVFIIIISVSLGIFAIQFFPTLELAQNSARYHIRDYALMYGANYLNKEYLKAMIFFDTDAPHTYVGLIIVFLAFLTFFGKHREKYYYFFVYGIIFFLILSSCNFITNYLYFHLPFLSFFKKPIRAGYIFIFSIALLAGIGIERIKFKLLKLTLLVLVLFSAYFSWQTSYLEKFASTYNNADVKSYLSIKNLIDTLKDKNIYRIFLSPEYTYFTRNNSCFSSGQSNLILLPYLEFTKTALNVSLIKEDSYYTFLLYPNYLKASGTKYILLDKKEDEDKENRGIIPEIKDYYENSPFFEKIYEDNMIKGYSFKDSMARAAFVNKAVFIKDKRQILDTLKDKTFDPKETVILEKEIPGLYSRNRPLELKSITYIINYQPDKVSISLKTNSRGFLVLSDTYYPGWKAYINDKRAAIYRANYLFRAIYINKPGEYTVKFIYSPFSFKLGVAISIITLICSLGGIFWLKKQP